MSGFRKVEHICLATTESWDLSGVKTISKDENIGRMENGVYLRRGVLFGGCSQRCL